MIYEMAEYTGKRIAGMKKQEEERRVRHSPNMVNLCVDYCGGERQSGRLYHMYTGKPIVFFTLFEAVNRMEELYDEIQFPQASTELRSFLADRKSRARTASGNQRAESKRREVREMEEFSEVIGHRGSYATFLIRVMYRQHSSWQGEVIWVDRQKKEYFRSVLELMRLLDSALNTEGKNDAE